MAKVSIGSGYESRCASTLRCARVTKKLDALYLIERQIKDLSDEDRTRIHRRRLRGEYS
jgi:hypothetical protein